MTVRVYNDEGHEFATYPSGLKVVRLDNGVLQIFKDAAKINCIAMHNTQCWSYVTVTEDDTVNGQRTAEGAGE
jgi:hypothetical protein